MNKILLLFFTLLNLQLFAQKINVANQIKSAETQYLQMMEQFPIANVFPQSIMPDGTYEIKKSEWWGSGFFGGALWYLYEYTHNEKWKIAADKWVMAVEKEQYNTRTHDLGFMLYCSLGNGYRLTSNEKYKKILLQGATTLCTRFNPTVGSIKSWDKFQGYKYPVIIDNMMNLEYLFWAGRQTGNKSFDAICILHADNTLKNHFRKDYSSYHVVCYDSTNGNVIAKKTSQGFSDSSAWARGQAWGLYGYTMMYRETHNKKYLSQAIHIADFYLNNPTLPADKIPYWDFNSTSIPNDVRDASAAAIAAAALLELCQYTKRTNSKIYFSAAEKMLESLSSPQYFAPDGNSHFLLKHSTGNKPAGNEIDVPIIYADYYYLQALVRYNDIKLKKIKI